MKAALKEHAAAPNYAASAGTRDSFGQIQLPASRQERSAIGHHWNHAAAEPLIILESTHLPAARTNFWGQVRLAAAIVAVLRCSLAFLKFRFKFTARTRSLARCDTLHLYDPAIYVLHWSEQMSNDSRFRSVPINLICGFNFCLGWRLLSSLSYYYWEVGRSTFGSIILHSTLSLWCFIRFNGRTKYPKEKSNDLRWLAVHQFFSKGMLRLCDESFAKRI